MLMDHEDSGELDSTSISYQNTAPDTEVSTNIFHQKTSENCDKNCEVTANSEKQQCTPTITNITPVRLRITVKSEKDLIEPSKSVPELEKNSKTVPELVEKPSQSVQELFQKPSQSVQELVQKPSQSVQELQKTSYNLDIEMNESNIQDPDLDQINVVDQIIATRKTAQ